MEAPSAMPSRATSTISAGVRGTWRLRERGVVPLHASSRITGSIRRRVVSGSVTVMAGYPAASARRLHERACERIAVTAHLRSADRAERGRAVSKSHPEQWTINESVERPDPALVAALGELS